MALSFDRDDLRGGGLYTDAERFLVRPAICGKIFTSMWQNIYKIPMKDQRASLTSHSGCVSTELGEFREQESVNEGWKMLRNNWQVKRPLPFGIADAPALSYGNKILIFGGYGTGPRDIRNQVLEYDAKKDWWQSRAAMRQHRWGATAALCGDKAYVFGGMTTVRFRGESVARSAECYDIGYDAWTMMNPLPAGLPSQGLMAVTVDQRIFIFNETLTFEFDPSSDNYSLRAKAPLARRWATCAHVKTAGEDRVYIIGGYDSAVSDATDANYYYLPSSDKWVGPCASAPYPAYGVLRENPSWRGRIFFGFGHRNPNLFFRDVYMFDPEGNSWAVLPRASYERDGVGCAVVDGALYVIGGRTEPNEEKAFGLTHNERLELKLEDDSQPSEAGV